MEGNKFSEPQRKDKSIIFFGMAMLCLFLLALLWSVDASIVYSLLGGAVFFFYLGFRNRPVSPVFFVKKEQRVSDRPSQPKSDFSFTDFLQAFRKKEKPDSSPAPRKPINLGRIMVMIFWLGFAVMLWLIFFVGGENEYTDEAFFQYQQGQNYYYKGEYDSALISYRQAIKISPGYTDAMAGYGNMLLAKGQRDSALIMLDNALEINPNHEIAQYYKAWFYYTGQDYSRALEIITSLVTQNPAYHDAVELKGSIYYALQKYDEALPLLDQAYAAGNRSQWLCHVMAYLYDTKGNTDRAIELYQEALAYDATTLSIYQRLGELIPGPEGDAYRTEAARLQQGK